LQSAGIINMFPHTSHVESIAVFERTGTGILHTPALKNDLTAALAWAQKTPAKASDLSELKMNKAYGTKS
jgi:hypothetical protein